MLSWTVDARAIVLSVSDISISSGQVYGRAIVLPVGATVSIGARVEDPTASAWSGLGLSYYGYDTQVVQFVDGESVPALFYAGCLTGIGGIGGLANTNLPNTDLVEDLAFAGLAAAGTERVRTILTAFVTSSIGLEPGSPNDAGLDGVCGGGDAHMRLTYEGVADGYTEIEIGTGDDLGGIVFGDPAETLQATNARLRIAVPEPSIAPAWPVAIGLLLLLGRRRLRCMRHQPARRASIPYRALASFALVLLATTAHATGDFDLDGVPDATDNCLVVPNGPAELSNQVDTDADGFGNACDPDFNQDGSTTNSDGAPLVLRLESVVSGPDLVYDLDGDSAVTINDVRIFFLYRATGAPPGPGALFP